MPLAGQLVNGFKPDDVELLLAIGPVVVILEVLHRHERVLLRRAVHDVHDATNADVMADVGHAEARVRYDDAQAGFLLHIDGHIESGPKKLGVLVYNKS